MRWAALPLGNGMERTFDYSCADRQDLARNEQLRLAHLLGGYQAFLGHELPNGLVSIQAYARLLLEHQAGRLDEESQHLLTRLADLSRRIDVMARQLADVGRLLREPPWGPPVAVEDVAREAVAEVNVLLAPRAVPFEITPPLGSVTASRPMLHRLLVHLLHDAAHAWSAGGPAVAISAEVQQVPPGILLCVHDPGMRLGDVQEGRVTELFQGGAGRGGGLGLFLARQMVALWAGRLTLRSEAGQGARILVYIPDQGSSCPAGVPDRPNPESRA